MNNRLKNVIEYIEFCLHFSRVLFSFIIRLTVLYVCFFFIFVWHLFCLLFLISQDIYWQFLCFIVFIMFFFVQFLFLGNIFLIFHFRLRYLLFLREDPYFILKSCFIYFLLFFLCLVDFFVTVSLFLSLSLSPPIHPVL